MLWEPTQIDQCGSRTRLGLTAEDVLVQELISKFADRIELSAELDKLRQLFMDALKFTRRSGKQLSPVRTRIERSQFFFDHGQQLAYGGPIGLPCGVNCHAVLLVAGAHPKPVLGGCADFGNQ